MSMTIGSRRGSIVAEINVTPMADIMIVLLIIFMVMTPYLDRPSVTLPEAENGGDEKEGLVVVVIEKDGATSLGGERMGTATALAAQIRKRLDDASADRRAVQLQADASLPYSEVARVMNACREAGVDEVALIVKPKVGGST